MYLIQKCVEIILRAMHFIDSDRLTEMIRYVLMHVRDTKVIIRLQDNAGNINGIRYKQGTVGL